MSNNIVPDNNNVSFGYYFLLSENNISSNVRIKSLTALVGRFSLNEGWVNGPERGLKTVLLNPYFKYNAAPDQTPCSVASELDLHC